MRRHKVGTKFVVSYDNLRATVSVTDWRLGLEMSSESDTFPHSSCLVEGGLHISSSVAESAVGGRSRNLILTAMIFAVSMMFIDQTIVSIAAPQIQRELGLSSTGMQWAINAYLLSLAALFAFGGRLADTLGHKRMAVTGVTVFAAASALCGLTPKGSLAEGWRGTFRMAHGAGGALRFP